MPVSASTVTVAQGKEPEANITQVTEVTINPTGELHFWTDVGQSDNRLPQANVRPWIVGSSSTLTGTATAIDVAAGGITSTQLAANAVNTQAIADNAVDITKLAPDALTNITNTPGMTTVDIESSTGGDTTILEATAARAGVLSSADWSRFDGGVLTTEEKGKLADTVWVTDSQFAGGADPTGATDSQPAIQAAIDYGVANNIHRVAFPKGSYRVDSQINLPKGDSVYNRFVIDLGGSRIRTSQNITVFGRTIADNSEAEPFSLVPVIRDGKLQSDVLGQGTGIAVHKAAAAVIQNVQLSNFATGIDLVFCLYAVVDGCVISEAVNYGIRCRDAGSAGITGVSLGESNMCHIRSTRVAPSVGGGSNAICYDVIKSANVLFTNCVGEVSSPAKTYLRFEGDPARKQFHVKLDGCWMEIGGTIGDAVIDLVGVAHSKITIDRFHSSDVPADTLFIRTDANCTANVITWANSQTFDQTQPYNQTTPWFTEGGSDNRWVFRGNDLRSAGRFSDVIRWTGSTPPPHPLLEEQQTWMSDTGQIYDTVLTAAPSSVLLNADSTTAATVKDVRFDDLPVTSPSVGDVGIYLTTAGALEAFDPTALTATSRKNGVDVVPFASALSIDFDAGNYDNKEVVLTGDVVDITLTATRQTDYELRFRQDATGFRNVFAVTTNISPNIKQVLLAPDSNQVSVWRLYYDGTTFHWG